MSAALDSYPPAAAPGWRAYARRWSAASLFLLLPAFAPFVASGALAGLSGLVGLIVSAFVVGLLALILFLAATGVRDAHLREGRRRFALAFSVPGVLAILLLPPLVGALAEGGIAWWTAENVAVLLRIVGVMAMAVAGFAWERASPESMGSRTWFVRLAVVPFVCASVLLVVGSLDDRVVLVSAALAAFGWAGFAVTLRAPAITHPWV